MFALFNYLVIYKCITIVTFRYIVLYCCKTIVIQFLMIVCDVDCFFKINLNLNLNNKSKVKYLFLLS